MSPTPRQLEVLFAICGSMMEHGRTPTLREIADAVGGTQNHNIVEILQRLGRHRLVKRPNRRQGHLDILEAGWRAWAEELTDRSGEALTGEEARMLTLTAKAMMGDREEILAAGCDDYLSKPVNPATLKATLQKWIKGETA